MPATDGAFDAPAYCEICDRPIAIGPLCDPCRYDHDEDEEDDDE